MTCADKHHLKDLLGRALAGDACAWNGFFREIRKYLHAEVRNVLGPNGQGGPDHSDIVQSTVRRILERIEGRFPNEPEDGDLRLFIGWISTIVRNRCSEALRKVKPERTQTAGAALEGVADPRPWNDTVRRDRLAAEVAAALARLPEKHRQVVELFWFERLSDAEISARLGCTQGALRVLRFRALRKLQSPKLRTLLEESHDGRC
jgi:RNA polymerase sigma-70 factor (ECF subfamily)